MSGERETGSAATGGYFIGRLDANFVTGVPTAFTWVFNVTAEGDHRSLQPWDVGGDGKVVYGMGAPYDPDWAAIHRLDAAGAQEVVEHWHAHWGDAGEWNGTPASSYTGTLPLRHSGVVLKASRKGSLRSPTATDFDLLQSDENGNPGRKGRFPDDYYFSGHCPLASGTTCPGGPGYTGYRIPGPETQRLGGIAIDRRSNHIYFGYSTKSRLPDGNPDFEPAVVAMRADGSLKWWARLYRETAQNSTPDQYVDGLAIDYAGNQLVVLARAHGNNVDNFWSGNTLAAAPGRNGFQNRFTGTNGNIHISWLGKYALDTLRVEAATWVAEYVEGNTNFGAAFTDPLLAGWPNPNAGWPNVNTTRNCGELVVRSDGVVLLACQGRRSITTSNAHQQMPTPSSGLTGTWNHFVRAYDARLGSVLYSSLLTGAWNTATGAGGDNTQVFGLAAAPGAIIAVGMHRSCDGSTSGTCAGLGAALARPNAVPTTGVPGWGSSVPSGESALVARLATASLDSGRLFENWFE